MTAGRGRLIFPEPRMKPGLSPGPCSCSSTTRLALSSNPAQLGSPGAVVPAQASRTQPQVFLFIVSLFGDLTKISVVKRGQI